MQTAPPSADLLSLIEASRLLPGERLAPYREPSGHEEPPVALASRLVRDGLLTPFQANILLQGPGGGFFLTDKYKLLDHLGTGGMGKVYLCEHLILQRLVAVKVLSMKAAPPGAARQGVIERFYREARAVAALDHRNIVRMFDADQTRGVPFMVMEYVDGVDLHKYVTAHGPLEPSRAADYVRQAAEGLQHAHEAGLIHRDIKPSNLLLDRTGVVKLLDLGLARFLVDSCRNESVTETYDTNVILGTADFMAPEQALDSSGVDIRADIYSLGCTLYFLLTGKVVFEAPTLPQKVLAHQMKTPTPLRQLRPEVCEALELVAGRMMAKNPEYRYRTPREVADALRPFAVPQPSPPNEGSMPKVAARSFRLGLCPPPDLASISTGSRPLPALSSTASRAVRSRTPVMATEVSMTDTTPDEFPLTTRTTAKYRPGSRTAPGAGARRSNAAAPAVLLVVAAVLGFVALTVVTLLVVRAAMPSSTAATGTAVEFGPRSEV